MKKRILAFVLCLCSVILLCGCGSINYKLKVSSDGKVTQSIFILYSRVDILNAQKSEKEFCDQISSLANSAVERLFENFENGFSKYSLTDEVKLYSGKTVPYSDVIDYVEQNIEPDSKRPKIEYTQSGNQGAISISLSFKSTSAYSYFYGTFPDEEEDDTVTENYFFYNKEINYSNTVYHDLENNSFANTMLEYFDGKYTLSDMDYSYSYSTPSSHIYSDADTVFRESDGNYIHTWKFSAADLKSESGDKYEIYTISYKVALWYVLAIVISLVVAGVLYIICAIKRDKAKVQGYNGTLNFGKVTDIDKEKNEEIGSQEQEEEKENKEANIK